MSITFHYITPGLPEQESVIRNTQKQTPQAPDFRTSAVYLEEKMISVKKGSAAFFFYQEPGNQFRGAVLAAQMPEEQFRGLTADIVRPV